MPLTNSDDRPRWESIDHFSMLPYSWIPDDGVDFFTQFIVYLKGRWLKLCDLAEEHLTQRVSGPYLVPVLNVYIFNFLILFDLLIKLIIQYSVSISCVRKEKVLNLYIALQKMRRS